MRSRDLTWLSATVIACFGLTTIAAIRGHSVASNAPSALPDWSGAWIIPEADFVQSLIREGDPRSPFAPALRPEYVAQFEAFGARRMTGRDPPGMPPMRTNSERCLPPGMPDLMRYPDAVEFLFTPGRVTLITEEGPTVRRIFTDGRGHSRDADPSFAGESIGHWEGATLVVDTRWISRKSDLIGPVHTSGQAHVIERIHLKDATHVQIDTVVDDPGALRRPWRYTRIYQRLTSGMSEYVCLDNDREPDGNEPDLTPPR